VITEPNEQHVEESSSGVNAEDSPKQREAEAFFSGAYARIVRQMIVIGLAGTAVSFIWGYRFGLGLLVGCIIAGLNFYWITRFAQRLGERAAAASGSDDRKPSRTRLVLRYLFIALVAYGIFRSSIVSLNGLLLGLFLPVPAILVEAVYETTVALRRGL